MKRTGEPLTETVYRENDCMKKAAKPLRETIKNAISALDDVVMHPEVKNKHFVIGMYIDTQSSLSYGLELTEEEKQCTQ